MSDFNSDPDDIRGAFFERLLLEAIPAGENAAGFRVWARPVEEVEMVGVSATIAPFLRGNALVMRDEDIELSMIMTRFVESEAESGSGFCLAPGAFHVAEPVIAMVKFPRAWAHVAGIDFGTRVRLSKSAELAFLGRYLVFLAISAREIPASLNHTLSRHIADLALACLAQAGDSTERGRGVKAARFAAIKADIRANIAKGALSLEDVARRQAISPRYLRSLFARERTSFTDFVLEQRLSNAFRMLIDSAASQMPITEIAYASGFNDLSYFNRVFKRRFGVTPREARKGSSQGQRVGTLRR